MKYVWSEKNSNQMTYFPTVTQTSNMQMEVTWTCFISVTLKLEAKARDRTWRPGLDIVHKDPRY